MSGHDIGREIGQAISDLVSHHTALPKREKNIHRAAMGTGLIAACCYTAWCAQGLTGMRASQFVTAFFHAPKSAPVEVWLPLAIWTGGLLLGVVWLLVGLRNSRGARDTMSIVWSAVRLCIPAALLLFRAYVPDWSSANLVLQCIYLMWLVGNLVELTLLVRGPGRAPDHNRPEAL